MNLPRLEECGNFVREARTPENMVGFIVAEIPLCTKSNTSGIAAEIARRCNEYDELQARVEELSSSLKRAEVLVTLYIQASQSKSGPVIDDLSEIRNALGSMENTK